MGYGCGMWLWDMVVGCGYVMWYCSLGVTVAKKIAKIGNRSSDTAQIFFEDVRVPQKNLIGEAGMGFIYQMEQFQEERLWCAASGESLGNAVDRSID